MSIKTTVALGFSLAILVLGYAFLRQSPAFSRSEPVAPPTGPAAGVARDLIAADQLGDVVKVTVRKGDGPAWVFEKDETAAAGATAWKIVEPIQAKAAGWEIDRLGRDLKGVKYEISYAAQGQGGISPADAGLEPPQAEVTLADAAGKLVTVQVGKPTAQSQTYLRLAGKDEIVLGKTNLKTSIKADIAEYRDTAAWQFNAEDAKRLEITDRHAEGGPTTYVFVRDGSRWTMEAPAVAKATNKVNDAVTALSRLRVMKWLPQSDGSFAALGLDPPALTIKATVEEQVSVEKPDEPDAPAEADEAKEGEPETPEEPATQTKTTIYEVHVSNLSPIGEDTKTHVRIAGENVAGTIMKTTTDKLKPVMSEWREMRLTTSDVDRATKIELTLGGESAVFIKSGEQWAFDSGAAAEQAEITTLLNAIKGLNAVVFLDGADSSGTYGLDAPRAHVALTVPGVEGQERLVIGGYTDEAAKRMLYARKGEGQVAKVRAPDVESILRPISTYQDRSVLSFDVAALQRLSLAVRNEFTSGMTTAVFEKDAAGGWQMVEPAKAAANAASLDTLASTLAGLRADTVAAASGDTAQFGLDAPFATITVTTSGAAPSAEGEAAEAAPIVHEIAVASHGGKWYAKRADRPTVYEVSNAVADQLQAEYRDRKLFTFDPKTVTRFSITQEGRNHAFVRKDSSWVYEPERDLPLNGTKVENLLLQIKDLEARRYVVHASADLAAFGMERPAVVVEVLADDGQEYALLLAELATAAPGASGIFATTGNGAILLLPEDVPNRIRVNLDELESA